MLAHIFTLLLSPFASKMVKLSRHSKSLKEIWKWSNRCFSKIFYFTWTVGYQKIVMWSKVDSFFCGALYLSVCPHNRLKILPNTILNFSPDFKRLILCFPLFDLTGIFQVGRTANKSKKESSWKVSRWMPSLHCML